MSATSPGTTAPSRRRRRLVALALGAGLGAGLIAALLPAGAAHAAGGTHFAGVYVSLNGARDYDGYVPSSYRSGTPMPLLVALHGCTETSGHLGPASGLTALAEQRGFIVVYPDQALAVNPAQCWNWFLSKNQRRGSGEAAIIAGITNLVRSRYTVDSRRVFVTGISAGANMSVIMAVTYPDIYAAAGVVAGCEYRCDITGLTPVDTQGERAYAEMGTRRRPVPIVNFQGTNDLVVSPSLSDRLVGQWAQTDDLALDNGIDDNDVDAVPDQVAVGQVPGGRTYTHQIFRANTSAVMVERYLVHGAGHSWPGGVGIFGDEGGPDASAIQWDFFLAHPMP
jgi:poly(hydroxyalkanoate) depolymerase family esterase